MRAQAAERVEKARAILELYESLKQRIQDMMRSQHAMQARDWILERPVFRSTYFIREAGIAEPTATCLLGC